MSYLRIMVLIPIDKETLLEEALKLVEMSCMHFLKVRGYGCNPNFYARDWSIEIAKFELIIKENQLGIVKKAIKSVCQTGAEDDGMIAVSTLSEMKSIKDLSKLIGDSKNILIGHPRQPPEYFLRQQEWS